MPDKHFEKLNILDKRLRRCRPVRGWCNDHVKVTIQMVNGFELFNTRPYHNYETWSDGYRVFDDDIQVEAEDLDDAVDKYIEARKRFEDGKAKPWELRPDTLRRERKQEVAREVKEGEQDTAQQRGYNTEDLS